MFARPPILSALPFRWFSVASAPRRDTPPVLNFAASLPMSDPIPNAAVSSAPATPGAREVVNVRTFGARGDGSVDDAPAFNAAFAAVRAATRYPAGAAPVYAPAGIYRLDSPVNMTAASLNLVGDGMVQTVLLGNTGRGRCVLDMTGAAFSSVRELSIYTHAEGPRPVLVPNPSSYGVVWIRHASLQSAEMNRLERVHVSMHTDAAANGGHGTLALYDCCGEVSSVRGCYLRGDSAVLLAGENVTRFASTYTPTQAGGSSMSVFEADRDTYLVGLARAAVAIHGGASFRIDSHLTNQYDQSTPAARSAGLPLRAPYPYAVEVAGQVHDLYLGGVVEAFPVSLGVIRSLVRGLRYHHHHAHGVGRSNVWLDGAEVLNSVFQPVPASGNYDTAGYLVECAAERPSKIFTSEIFAYGNQGLRSRNRSAAAEVTACRIFTDQPLKDFVLDFPTARGNMISSPTGTSINGVMVWPC